MECNPPTGLEVSGLTATSATLSWDAVAPADQYVLAIRNNTTGNRNSRQVVGTSWTFDALEPGHSYTFRTKSVCYPDGISGPSEEVDFTTPLRLGVMGDGMTVYPNPGNGTFQLAGWSSHNTSASMIITDIAGSVVFSAELGEGVNADPMPVQLDVPSGLYILQVQGDASAYKETIVVE